MAQTFSFDHSEVKCIVIVHYEMYALLTYKKEIALEIKSMPGNGLLQQLVVAKDNTLLPPIDIL